MPDSSKQSKGTDDTKPVIVDHLGEPFPSHVTWRQQWRSLTPKAKTLAAGLTAVVVGLAAILTGIQSIVKPSRPEPFTPSVPGYVIPSDPASERTLDTPTLIEHFEIQRWRIEAGTGVTRSDGSIGPDHDAVIAGTHRVTVHAKLAEPAYIYLLSFDTDGIARLRVPADADVPPTRSDRLDYPADLLTDPRPNPPSYAFTRGPGIQGFMLIASHDPLPAWSEWSKYSGTPGWSKQEPTRGFVVWEGMGQPQFFPSTREPTPTPGRIVMDPVEWANDHLGAAEPSFIAFPVLNSEDE